MADIRSLLDSAATYDPNYVYGALLPMRKNKKTKDVELALPGIFKDMAQAVTSPMRALEGKIDPMSPEAVTEAANIAGLLGGSSVAATGTRRMPKGQVNHTVWHGSPHKFDKFDMSKIGTGEGAQAYGHGLYFAENENVANAYRKNLTGSNEIKRNGVRIATIQKDGTLTPLTTDSYAEAASLAQFNGNKQSAIDSILYSAKNSQDETFKQKMLSLADYMKKNKYEFNDGSLYKVDIPDEILPRMLDWDKPLSQQAPEVQAALDAVVQRKASGNMFDPSGKFPRRSGFKEASGSDAIKMLQSAVRGDVRAEGLLQEAGIPGIRYLDGNSRGTGGTSNFVLFDDRLPRIIERNGVPTGLLPWKDDPEALRGLLGR